MRSALPFEELVGVFALAPGDLAELIDKPRFGQHSGLPPVAVVRCFEAFVAGGSAHDSGHAPRCPGFSYGVFICVATRHFVLRLRIVESALAPAVERGLRQLGKFPNHGKRGFDTAVPNRHTPAMQAMQFDQSVGSILKRDRRYDPHAYFFLKEALDFTLKRIAEGVSGQSRHVSGPQLLVGFRDLALAQFGPMAVTLMTEWGVRKCSDVGEMVFNLIDEQIFGRQESDCKEDFIGAFDLEDALRQPFLPKAPTDGATDTRRRAAAPAPQTA